MRKLLAGLLLLIPAAMVSGAQDNPERPGLVTRGTMEDIPITEMLQVMVEYEKMRVLYNPRKVVGVVTISSPTEGLVMKPHEMRPLMQDILSQFRLAAVQSGNMWQIVPSRVACTRAPVVPSTSLDEYPEDQQVAVLVPLEHTDAKSVRRVAQNLTSRTGGSVVPVGNAVLICDRCKRARELLKIVNEMEDAARLSTRRYALPAGADADEWGPAVRQLIAGDSSRLCVVSSAPGGDALVVTGSESVHGEIEQAIEALK